MIDTNTIDIIKNKIKNICDILGIVIDKTTIDEPNQKLFLRIDVSNCKEGIEDIEILIETPEEPEIESKEEPEEEIIENEISGETPIESNTGFATFESGFEPLWEENGTDDSEKSKLGSKIKGMFKKRSDV